MFDNFLINSFVQDPFCNFFVKFKIEPIFETFPGWKESTRGVRNIENLPDKAKKYIYALEDFVEAKISSVSTSPERENTILLENPFS